MLPKTRLTWYDRLLVDNLTGKIRNPRYDTRLTVMEKLGLQKITSTSNRDGLNSPLTPPERAMVNALFDGVFVSKPQMGIPVSSFNLGTKYLPPDGHVQYAQVPSKTASDTNADMNNEEFNVKALGNLSYRADIVYSGTMGKIITFHEGGNNILMGNTIDLSGIKKLEDTLYLRISMIYLPTEKGVEFVKKRRLYPYAYSVEGGGASITKQEGHISNNNPNREIYLEEGFQDDPRRWASSLWLNTDKDFYSVDISVESWKKNEHKEQSDYGGIPWFTTRYTRIYRLKDIIFKKSPTFIEFWLCITPEPGKTIIIDNRKINIKY